MKERELANRDLLLTIEKKNNPDRKLESLHRKERLDTLKDRLDTLLEKKQNDVL
jgi:hypothetical protein